MTIWGLPIFFHQIFQFLTMNTQNMTSDVLILITLFSVLRPYLTKVLPEMFFNLNREMVESIFSESVADQGSDRNFFVIATEHRS